LPVHASLKFLKSHPDLSLTLVGDQFELHSLLAEFYSGEHKESAALKIVHAEESVSMEDRPSSVLKNRKSSSMAKAMEILSRNPRSALVSSGNTGALITFASKYLQTLPGVDRVALCKPMPSRSGICFLLDLGANLQSSPETLYQYALMGSALCRLNGISEPRVGLINVGTEAHKGGRVLKDAGQKIAQIPHIQFRGFIEGGDIYKDQVDLAVCDGFTGNVLLKASEGAAELMLNSLKKAFKVGVFSRLIGVVAKPVLRRWIAQFNPSKHNGAIVLGLDAVVVKCHGDSDETGFESALSVAFEQVSTNLPEAINKLLNPSSEKRATNFLKS